MAVFKVAEFEKYIYITEYVLSINVENKKARHGAAKDSQQWWKVDKIGLFIKKTWQWYLKFFQSFPKEKKSDKTNQRTLDKNKDFSVPSVTYADGLKRVTP